MRAGRWARRLACILTRARTSSVSGLTFNEIALRVSGLGRSAAPSVDMLCDISFQGSGTSFQTIVKGASLPLPPPSASAARNW